MTIQLLKPWSQSAPGDVLTDVPTGTAELLVKRGIAKLIDETKVNTKPLLKRIRRK